MSLIFTIIVIVLIILTIITLYNKNIQHKNAVKRAWSNIIANERQKDKVLPKVEEISKSYAKYESSLQEKVTKLRTALNKSSTQKVDTSVLSEVQASTQDLIKGIQVAVENYPDLKAAGVMRDLMQQIAMLEQNVTAAIVIFNRDVEIFNDGIQMFPGSIVNALLNRFQKIEPFTDSQAASDFEYQFKG